MPGVQPRGNSIRISFYYRGARYRETLKLKPTKANLKYAVRLRDSILFKIEKGIFEYADYFPDSPNARISSPGSNLSLKDALNDWLERIEKSVAERTASFPRGGWPTP